MCFGKYILKLKSNDAWGRVPKAGTAGLRENVFGWTKWDWYEQIVGHLLRRKNMLTCNIKII